MAHQKPDASDIIFEMWFYVLFLIFMTGKCDWRCWNKNKKSAFL